MAHTIITIARQYGSGGRTVGKMLAEQLHIPYYDREIIALASEDSGINARLFEDEKLKSPLRGLLKPRGIDHYNIQSPESAGFTKDDNLFALQAKIIRELSDRGPCIIIGRCADHVLSSKPGVVSVFVHAKPDFCLREAMKVNSLPERDVLRLIEKTDDYRAKYYKYCTGKNWNDARNYDLSLDSSRLGFEGTAKAILAYIAQRPDCDPFPSAGENK